MTSLLDPVAGDPATDPATPVSTPSPAAGHRLRRTRRTPALRALVRDAPPPGDARGAALVVPGRGGRRSRRCLASPA
jgi:hypothetical protein